MDVKAYEILALQLAKRYADRQEELEQAYLITGKVLSTLSRVPQTDLDFVDATLHCIECGCYYSSTEPFHKAGCDVDFALRYMEDLSGA